MVAAQPLRRASYADYLALERETDLRHEYVSGEAWVMAGGMPRHSKLRTNLTGLVGGALGPGPWDRGGKFNHFQRMPSLQHYVLVSQEAARVERFTRVDAANWSYTVFGPGETVELPAIEAVVELDALYRNLPEE